MKEGLFIKKITQYERDLLKENGFLKGEKKVYVSSISKRGKAKRYYTLDWLADKVQELKNDSTK